MGSVQPLNQKQTRFCELCGGPGTSEHHLFPRCMQRLFPYIGWRKRFKTMLCCTPCHNKIHIFFSPYDLAFVFNQSFKIKAELVKRERVAAVLK